MWGWDAVQDATGYRLWWTTNCAVWLVAQSVFISGTSAPDTAPVPVPGQVMFYQVQALGDEIHPDGRPPSEMVSCP